MSENNFEFFNEAEHDMDVNSDEDDEEFITPNKVSGIDASCGSTKQ